LHLQSDVREGVLRYTTSQGPGLSPVKLTSLTPLDCVPDFSPNSLQLDVLRPITRARRYMYARRNAEGHVSSLRFRDAPAGEFTPGLMQRMCPSPVGSQGTNRMLLNHFH